MQGVCDTSGEQILMSETKYIIQASYLFGKDKIQLWLSCLALEQGKKKKEFKGDCADPLWPGWIGLWATWASDGCPYPLQRGLGLDDF